MGSLVATGILTIVDTNDGLNAFLSQNACVVSTDSTGNGGNFSACSSTVKVMLGQVDDTAKWTISAAASTGVTGSLAGATYTVNGMSLDAGYVDFTVSRTGYPTSVLRFSISKSKAGAQGTAGANGTPGAAGLNGLNFAEAKSLYKDPAFNQGTNYCSAYNNVGGGTLTLERVLAEPDSPYVTTSAYNLKITSSGTIWPGIGGFYQWTATRANAVFVQRIFAKIPAGYTIEQASNQIGTDGTHTWLTSQAGTGKFQEYILKRICGSSGAFDSTGFIYLNGPAATPAAPIVWYVAFAGFYDFTAPTETSITAILSNETHSVPTDSAGNNGNYSGCATTMTVFNATINDTSLWTFAAAPSSGVAGTLSGSTFTVSSMTVDAGYVDITASRTGFSSITCRFSISKSKAGAQGAVGAAGANGAPGTPGAQGPMGPTVTITPSRAATFTSTDGVPDSGQPDITFTASVTGIASPTYVWSFSGFQNAPLNTGTSSMTVSAAQFGTAASATVSCVVSGAYSDKITVVRLERSTAAVSQNLIDTSSWTRSGPLPWAQNGEQNSILSAPDDFGGILGPKGVPDLVWYAKEVTGNGGQGGGWNNGTFKYPLEKNKTYRFVLPVRNFSGDGNLYWGIFGVNDLNTTNVNGNPYFASINYTGLQADRWYLFVGYIYPYGSTGNSHAGSGIYDCKTGKLIQGGLNYCHTVSGDVVHRAYQFYSSINSSKMFGRPVCSLVDGREPSLSDYFEPSATLNQELIPQISQAGTTANWSGVSGSGKPQDNATVGGTIGVNVGGAFTPSTAPNYGLGALATKSNIFTSGNLLSNSDFSDGTTGWSFGDAGSGTDGYPNNGINRPNADWIINRGVGPSTNNITLHSNAPQGYYAEWWSTSIPVKPGDKMIASAYTGAHRCEVVVFAYFYDASANVVGNLGGWVTNNEEASGGTSLSGWKRTYSVGVVPAGAATARLILRKNATKAGYADSWMFASRAMIEVVGADVNEPTPWALGAGPMSQLAKITPSNIATYMTEGVIGTAFIENVIKSKNYDGTNGWAIDQGGTAYFGNGNFRGAINSSTINSSTLNTATINAGRMMGGAYSGYGWPAAGQNGYYIGPEGLLLGNLNNGKYFQVTADGNVYAPGLTIDNGTASFDRLRVTKPNVIASGTFINSNGTGNKVFIYTGITAPGGWTSASTTMYACSATISGGTSWNGGSTHVTTATVALGDGLNSGANTGFIDNGIYICAEYLGWNVSPTMWEWKLVQL